MKLEIALFVVAIVLSPYYTTFTSTVSTYTSCGGTLKEKRGILSTPNFPNKFPVPIDCEWVISSSNGPPNERNTSIVVYLTQLYLQEGLSFYQYPFYDVDRKVGESVIHKVNETNVIKVSYVQTFENFLVVRLRLDNIDGTHIRVLDNFLDVYGFNITYEITTNVRENSCTMKHCGFTGICYDYVKHFGCECLNGYSGPSCSQGPRSSCYINDLPTCKNGATCTQVGDAATECDCGDKWKGIKCDTMMDPIDNFKNAYCLYDGKPENNCKCNVSQSLPTANPAEDVAHTITMTLKKDGYNKLEDLRLIIDNYARDLQTRGSTDHQKPNFRKEMFIMRSIHVVHLKSVRNGYELKLSFFAKITEEKRVRLMANRWMEQERFGNLTLVDGNISRETYPILSIQGINHSLKFIQQGEDLSLTCTGTGSPQMAFRWWKDGVAIIKDIAGDKITEKLIENKPGEYTAILIIHKVTVMDQGRFTCQVDDFGLQLCTYTDIEVRTAPKVWLQPMSLTVRKGNEFRIKCFSKPNYKHGVKYTYNWIKNKELLPVKTDTEHYEILHPMGSILQVSSINKTTTYSCVVQDMSMSSERSIVVNVIDKEVRSTCAGETHLNVLWPETAAGTENLQECPNPNYMGIARRRCKVGNLLESVWQMPDYSQCTSEKLVEADLNFERLRRGYEFTTPHKTLIKYQRYLTNGILLPGEGARVLHLISNVVSHINTSKHQRDVNNTTASLILDVVHRIMLQKDSLIDEDQVVLLQNVVKNQAILSGTLLNHNLYESYGTLDMNLAVIDKKSATLLIPFHNYKYSDWFNVRMYVKFGATDYKKFVNESVKMSMIVYKNLTEFLPSRSVIRMKDGIEMEYEIVSNIASVWIFKNKSEISLHDTSLELEFIHKKRTNSMESWKILCAISDLANYGQTWNPHSCETIVKKSTTTTCKCTRSGTFSILWINEPTALYNDSDKYKQYIVFIGCSLCLLMISTTSFMLLAYFFIRQSCILFLKIQCCLSLLGCISIFLYADSMEVSNHAYLHVMTSIECFMLMSLSSQLSKILIIYAEILHLPTKNVKQTIVGIITCAPIIAIFGSHIAHRSMNIQLTSWWLVNGSLSFNIFIACTSIIILLFFILYYIVMKNLLNVLEYDKTSDLLQKRLKLLKRSAFIFSSITLFIFGSILYVNCKTYLMWHCIFAAVCVIMGLIIIVSYILKSELSMKEHFLKKLEQKKKDKFKTSSLKVITLFNFEL